MRVAYLSHSPLPSGDTNTEQLVQTTAALQAEGLLVRLWIPRLTATPSEVAQFYGVPPARLPELSPLQLPNWLPEVAVEGWHDLIAPLRAARTADLLYTRDPLALVTALATGRPTLFETFKIHYNSRPLFAPWRRWCYARPNLRGVVLHSRLALESFARAGIPPDRLLLAYNGYQAESMLPVLGKPEARGLLGLPREGPLAVYAGHLRPDKGTDALMRLAADCPEAHFVLVGATAPVPRGLPNLSVLPRVPPARVAPYLYAADCLLIPPTAAPLQRWGKTVLPMKTFLYLAAGRPILAPRLPDLEEVLEDERNALLVPPDAPEAAARALRRLLADSELAARLSRRAEEDARNYTWQGRARRIASFLSAVPSPPPAGRGPPSARTAIDGLPGVR